MFKVVKTPVPIEDQPGELQQLLGYDFFSEDAETGHPIEFDKLMNPDTEKDFWRIINDLARDICDMLNALQQGGADEPGHEPEPDSVSVYLAETGSDLKDERNEIKRILDQQRCRLLRCASEVGVIGFRLYV